MAFNSTKLYAIAGQVDYRPFTEPGYSRIPTSVITPDMGKPPVNFRPYGPLEGPEFRFSSERSAPEWMRKDNTYAALHPIHGEIDLAPQLARVRLPQVDQFQDFLVNRVEGNQPIAGSSEEPWERPPMTTVALPQPYRENPEYRTEPNVERFHGYGRFY